MIKELQKKEHCQLFFAEKDCMIDLTKASVSSVVPSFHIDFNWNITKQNQRIENTKEFQQHSYLMAAMNGTAIEYFKTHLKGKTHVVIEHFIFKFLVGFCLFFFSLSRLNYDLMCEKKNTNKQKLIKKQETITPLLDYASNNSFAWGDIKARNVLVHKHSFFISDPMLQQFRCKNYCGTPLNVTIFSFFCVKIQKNTDTL